MKKFKTVRKLKWGGATSHEFTFSRESLQLVIPNFLDQFESNLSTELTRDQKITLAEQFRADLALGIQNYPKENLTTSELSELATKIANDVLSNQR